MDANLTAVIFGGIAGFLTSGLPILYQWWRDKKKAPQEEITVGLEAQRDAASTVITYSGELRTLRLEFSELRIKFNGMQEKIRERDVLIDDWREGIDRLIAQLISLRQTPVWRPRPEQLDMPFTPRD